jgi:hypothetical protein
VSWQLLETNLTDEFYNTSTRGVDNKCIGFSSTWNTSFYFGHMFMKISVVQVGVVLKGKGDTEAWMCRLISWNDIQIPNSLFDILRVISLFWCLVVVVVEA